MSAGDSPRLELVGWKAAAVADAAAEWAEQARSMTPEDLQAHEVYLLGMCAALSDAERGPLSAERLAAMWMGSSQALHSVADELKARGLPSVLSKAPRPNWL